MPYQAQPAVMDGGLRRSDRSLTIPPLFAWFARMSTSDRKAHLIGFSGANCVIGLPSLWILHGMGYFGNWAAPSPLGAVPVVLGSILMAMGLRLLSKPAGRTPPLS